MDPMLRKALRKYSGLRQQLENILLGEDGDMWEVEFKKFLAKRPCWPSSDSKVGNGKMPKSTNLLVIDRSKPFNPAEFISKGWSFWRGPADGNGLEGDLEQDEKSLTLTELDLSKVLLETQLRQDEEEFYITGEERIKRLTVANRICLDLGIFQVLWENQRLIPESWKGKTVFFDGQRLRGSCGDRHTLYLCWYGYGWGWNFFSLSGRRHVRGPSAVLAL